jgi:hypothetical protein
VSEDSSNPFAGIEAIQESVATESYGLSNREIQEYLEQLRQFQQFLVERKGSSLTDSTLFVQLIEAYTKSTVDPLKNRLESLHKQRQQEQIQSLREGLHHGITAFQHA